jgi:hypothetical protein
MPEDVDLSWAHEGVGEAVGDTATDGHGETPPMHGGWRDPEIDAAGVVACGGLVPARCRGGEAAVGAEVDDLTGLAVEASEVMEPVGVESVTDAEGLADGADGVGDGLTGEAAGGGCDDHLTTAAERAERQNVRNEAKIDENVNVAQHEYDIEVMTGIGVGLGLDNLGTKPKLDSSPGLGGSDSAAAVETGPGLCRTADLTRAPEVDSFGPDQGTRTLPWAPEGSSIVNHSQG